MKTDLGGGYTGHESSTGLWWVWKNSGPIYALRVSELGDGCHAVQKKEEEITAGHREALENYRRKPKGERNPDEPETQ